MTPKLLRLLWKSFDQANSAQTGKQGLFYLPPWYELLMSWLGLNGCPVAMPGTANQTCEAIHLQHFCLKGLSMECLRSPSGDKRYGSQATADLSVPNPCPNTGRSLSYSFRDFRGFIQRCSALEVLHNSHAKIYCIWICWRARQN